MGITYCKTCGHYASRRNIRCPEKGTSLEPCDTGTESGKDFCKKHKIRSSVTIHQRARGKEVTEEQCEFLASLVLMNSEERYNFYPEREPKTCPTCRGQGILYLTESGDVINQQERFREGSLEAYGCNEESFTCDACDGKGFLETGL